jgi:hypothetical protein
MKWRGILWSNLGRWSNDGQLRWFLPAVAHAAGGVARTRGGGSLAMAATVLGHAVLDGILGKMTCGRRWARCRRHVSVGLWRRWVVTLVVLWPPNLVGNLHHEILVPLLSYNCNKRRRINAHKDLPWWLGFWALRKKFDLFQPVFIWVFTPNRSLGGLLLILSRIYL